MRSFMRVSIISTTRECLHKQPQANPSSPRGRSSLATRVKDSLNARQLNGTRFRRESCDESGESEKQLARRHVCSPDPVTNSCRQRHAHDVVSKLYGHFHSDRTLKLPLDFPHWSKSPLAYTLRMHGLRPHIHVRLNSDSLRDPYIGAGPSTARSGGGSHYRWIINSPLNMDASAWFTNMAGDGSASCGIMRV